MKLWTALPCHVMGETGAAEVGKTWHHTGAGPGGGCGEIDEGRSKQRHTDKGNHGPGLPTDQRELGFEGIVASTQVGWEHKTSRDKLHTFDRRDGGGWLEASFDTKDPVSSTRMPRVDCVNHGSGCGLTVGGRS